MLINLDQTSIQKDNYTTNVITDIDQIKDQPIANK